MARLWFSSVVGLQVFGCMGDASVQVQDSWRDVACVADEDCTGVIIDDIGKLPYAGDSADLGVGRELSFTLGWVAVAFGCR
jgi:hypothetical protein